MITGKMDKAALEAACKEIIETILFCIPNAYKGTVYEIGLPPDLVATRVASGIIDDNRETITWNNVAANSDYNYPGKPWTEYRDQPGRPKEAMSWCVSEQKSWTAEDPAHDSRSVRLQVEGVLDDFHHMEPVLIKKADFFNGNGDHIVYPTDYDGKVIWQDKDSIVVAIIKIHFKPHTIKIGGPETKIIKKLSRVFGTELLSYQLKRDSLERMRQVAKEKIDSCNILAHTLRNTIAKSGLIFSLIKLELGELRTQWEKMLLENAGMKEMKREAIAKLNSMLEKMDATSDELGKSLIDFQNRFMDMSLPPDIGEKWVHNQIEEKWKKLLENMPSKDIEVNEIYQSIDNLKKSLYLGKDPALLSSYRNISDSLKEEWTSLIYKHIDRPNPQFLEKLSSLLQDRSLNLPQQEKSRKSLMHLKALVETIGELEKNTNLVLERIMQSDNGTTKTT